MNTQKTKHKSIRVAIGIALVIVLGAGVIVGIKLYNHYTARQAMIEDVSDFMAFANKVFDGTIHDKDLTEETGYLWSGYIDSAHKPYENTEYSYELKIIDINHDYQSGYIEVCYLRFYRDVSTGEIVDGDRGTRIWYIEKIDGVWRLVSWNPIRA
jgi:hypothetical protein